MCSRPTGADGLRILVADDLVAIREVVTEHLESLGYQVLQAGDGEMALEMARDESPALIILDVNMPKLNGWEVVRRLRADPETADIKILMVSSLGEDVLSNTLPVLGGDAALDKPFHLEELEAAVRSLLPS